MIGMNKIQNPNRAPKIPTGKELYDSIMVLIEPDLLSGNLTRLSALANDDTPLQHSKRVQRYKKAMIEYRRKYEERLSQMCNDVRRYESHVRSWCEKRSIDQNEKPLLEKLTTYFSQKQCRPIKICSSAAPPSPVVVA
jgi:hypothetical protein